MTDESALKKQVRDRMAATGEKYTVARRIVVEDKAVRDLVHREFEAAGISRIGIERTAGRMQVDVYSARPGSVVGLRGEEADRVRGRLTELTGGRVSLRMWETRAPGPSAI